MKPIRSFESKISLGNTYVRVAFLQALRVGKREQRWEK